MSVLVGVAASVEDRSLHQPFRSLPSQVTMAVRAGVRDGTALPIRNT